MAQRYLGIDIGERAVRVVELLSGPRSLSVGRYHEARINRSDDREEAVRSALDELGQAPEWNAEVVAASLSSSAVFSTRIDLPFNDAKLIAQVLPMKTVGTLPTEEDDILAFSILGQSEETGEYEALVVSTPGSVIGSTLDALEAVDCDPQVVSPLAYSQHLLGDFLHPEEVGVYALVDIGARRTVCSILEGGVYQLSRTILCAGDAMSEAIAQALDLDSETAEGLKIARGFVSPPGAEEKWSSQLGIEPAHAGGQPVDPAKIAAALRDALTPVVFVLRQTLARYSVDNDRPVERIELIGAAALLPGLPQYLSMLLGIEVKRLIPERGDLNSLFADEGVGTEALAALSLALAASKSSDSEGLLYINMRQGAFSHKGGFDFLREHFASIAVMLVAILFAVGFVLGAKYYALKAERENLESTITEVTQGVFGDAIMDIDKLKAKVKSVQGFDLIPERTAYYHLNAISHLLSTDFSEVNNQRTKHNEALPEDAPPLERLNFEILKLTVNTTSKTVSLHALASNIDALELIKSSLSRYKCFPGNLNEANQKTSKKYSKYIEFKLKTNIKTVCEEDS